MPQAITSRAPLRAQDNPQGQAFGRQRVPHRAPDRSINQAPPRDCKL